MLGQLLGESPGTSNRSPVANQMMQNGSESTVARVEASFDLARGVFDQQSLEQTLSTMPRCVLTKRALANGVARSGELVEYRGMVQDMFDPEVFCMEFENMTNGNRVTSCFRDVLPQPYAALPNSRLAEREVMYLVPVPGETAWMHDTYLPKESEPIVTSEFMDLSRMKRPNITADTVMDVVGESMHSDNKRIRAEPAVEKDAKPAVILTENNPLGDSDNQTPCMVKLYDGMISYPGRARRLKLRDVVRIVGLLSLENNCQYDEDNAFNDARDCLPVSVAPRIHVLSIIIEERPLALSAQPSYNFDATRHSCLQLLTSCLSGDSLAAEFALLWLVSGVSNRDPLLGKVSLALTRVNRDVSETFTRLLGKLIPRFQVLGPADLHLGFQPKKDMELNRLRAGKLQCADGTRIIFDETNLAECKLSQTELANLEALNRVFESQQISYDFSFFQTDQDVDFPSLLLTTNTRPCLIRSIDLTVPLTMRDGSNPQHDLDAAIVLLGHQLESCRSYLETGRNLALAMDFGNEVAKCVENDFVESRRSSNDAKITEQDLHVWLNLSRLMAASFGAQQVNANHYNRVRSMVAAIGKPGA